MDSECQLRIKNNDVNWQIKFNQAEETWLNAKKALEAAHEKALEEVRTQVVELQSKIEAYEAGQPQPQSWMDKVTSRKFLAYLASLLPPIFGLLTGNVTWQNAVIAIIVVSFGYMGINVADSFAYSNQVRSQADLLKTQLELKEASLGV